MDAKGDLMVQLAKVMKHETIATELSKALETYKEDPNDENQHRVSFTATLWITKDILEKSFSGDPSEMSNEFNRFKDRENLFNPGKN